MKVPERTHYGKLIQCFKVCQSDCSYCYVQLLDPVLVGTSITVQAMSESRCPVYKLQSKKSVINASEVRSAVSFVHDCKEGCKIIKESVQTTIEREDITEQEQTVYQHDDSNNSNNRYNIFCLNNNMPIMI